MTRPMTRPMTHPVTHPMTRSTSSRTADIQPATDRTLTTQSHRGRAAAPVRVTGRTPVRRHRGAPVALLVALFVAAGSAGALTPASAGMAQPIDPIEPIAAFISAAPDTGPISLARPSARPSAGEAAGFAASVPPLAVIGGALDWGLRASFRSYVTGPIARGAITVTDGTSINTNGTFHFPSNSLGSLTDLSHASGGFAGTVNFTGHSGALNLELTEPRVTVNGTTGTLVVDLTSSPVGEPVETWDDLELATLDLTGITATPVDGGARWSSVPTVITAAGAPAMSDFYPAGTPLDPVSFTLLTTDAPGAPANGSFVGTTPTRLVDSRDGTGTEASPWSAAQQREVTVAGGTTGIPSDALAVVLNITGVLPSATTHLTVWPAGQTMPVASSLNLPAGSVRPNLVTVKVGTNGAVSIFNNVGNINVIADAVGYFEVDDSLPGRFNGLTPTRLIDSRDGTGTTLGPWTAGQARTIVVAGGNSPVPADASSVVLNLTGASASVATHLTVWPAGEAQPEASNLNLSPGPASANLVMAKLGATGDVSIFNNSGSVHVIADLVGYFGATGQRFTPVTPTRLVDSRDGLGTTMGPWAAGSQRVVDLTRGPIPADAGAVMSNLTGVAPSADTHITAWSGDTTMPIASNLNLAMGDVRANQAVTALSDTGTSPIGTISVFNNSGAAGLLVDVVGYFL